MVSKKNEWNKAYNKRKYHSDPIYRSKCLELSRRYYKTPQGKQSAHKAYLKQKASGYFNPYQKIKYRKTKLKIMLNNLVNEITLKIKNTNHQTEYHQISPEEKLQKELITITLRNGKTKTLTRKQNERRERTKKYLREYMKRRYHTEGDPWKERIKKQIIEWQSRNQDKKRAYVRKYFTIEEHRQHRREWHKARRAKLKQKREQALKQNTNPLQVKQVIKEMTNEGYDWDNHE